MASSPRVQRSRPGHVRPFAPPGNHRVNRSFFTRVKRSRIGRVEPSFINRVRPLHSRPNARFHEKASPPVSPMPTHAGEIVFPRRAHDTRMRGFVEHGKCGEMRGRGSAAAGTTPPLSRGGVGGVDFCNGQQGRTRVSAQGPRTGTGACPYRTANHNEPVGAAPVAARIEYVHPRGCASHGQAQGPRTGRDLSLQNRKS